MNLGNNFGMLIVTSVSMETRLVITIIQTLPIIWLGMIVIVIGQKTTILLNHLIRFKRVGILGALSGVANGIRKTELIDNIKNYSC